MTQRQHDPHFTSNRGVPVFYSSQLIFRVLQRVEKDKTITTLERYCPRCNYLYSASLDHHFHTVYQCSKCSQGEPRLPGVLEAAPTLELLGEWFLLLGWGALETQLLALGLHQLMTQDVDSLMKCSPRKLRTINKWINSLAKS